MSGIDNPFVNPAAWTTCDLGGQTTPGRCEVDGANDLGWDAKTGKGADGGTTTYTGSKPAEFDVEFFLWTVDHFIAWDAIRPLLTYQPTKGRPVTATPIYHPALADLGITSVVVKKMTVIKPTGLGEYSFKITFLQYKPPPPVSAVATPKSSTGLPGGAAPVDPEVAALRGQIEELTKHAQGAYAQ